jgi:tRNA(Ile)-lysidine synthase
MSIQVSMYLGRFSVPAPPGTFILAADKLSTTVKDPLIQLALVLRILRYISPYPWGSARAHAGRRKESLRRIVQRVWDPNPASKDRTRFEAGANVLWTPFRISRYGRLKHGQPLRGERFGWLASRAPIPRVCQSDFDRDISTELSPQRRRAEVMYDNRFLITFRLDAIPPGDPIMKSVIEGSGRIVLVLRGRWLWPQVVWRRKGEEDVTAACISAPELDWFELSPDKRRNYSTSEKVPEVRPPWQDAVDFKFIRVLDEP